MKFTFIHLVNGSLDLIQFQSGTPINPPRTNIKMDHHTVPTADAMLAKIIVYSPFWLCSLYVVFVDLS